MWPSKSALEWIQKVLQERFGCSFALDYQKDVVSLSVPDSNGRIDIVNDRCFSGFGSELPCGAWNADGEGWESVLREPLPVPGLNPVPEQLVQQTEYGFFIKYDILGLVYWMLSRREEVGRFDLDIHGRFSAESSHAYKNGYLERPVVDEWLAILSQVVSKTWPALKLRTHSFRLNVTCDVDTPYLSYTRSAGQTFRVVLADLLKRRNISQAVLNFRRYLRRRRNDFSLDPFWNGVEWIMSVNEACHNKVSFYFIADHPNIDFDQNFPLSEVPLKRMFRDIVSRGHEIGLHPSYGTYQDREQTVKEAGLLRQAMRSAGSQQQYIGGRQHYLRWSVEATPANWVEAGMAYDSSLGYADRPGFRCGTCHEFPMFDPLLDKEIPLRQKPLIMMETTVLSDQYLGLGSTPAALKKMLDLKRICVLFGGQYTILWHNSSLQTQSERDIYLKLIDGDRL